MDNKELYTKIEDKLHDALEATIINIRDDIDNGVCKRLDRIETYLKSIAVVLDKIYVKKRVAK